MLTADGGDIREESVIGELIALKCQSCVEKSEVLFPPLCYRYTSIDPEEIGE